MHINITDSETGNNKESCARLVDYLEKENRHSPHGDKSRHMEHWFNGIALNITHQEVRVRIDNNVARLGSGDAKFYLVNISPSQKEVAHLVALYGENGAKEKLKEFAVNVMDEYARNFKRNGIERNGDLLWYGKLENFRYYGHGDSEVKQGLKKIGERKEGGQMHVQVIVGRKDITNRVKLSPMNTSRGRNREHSAKLGQFDRRAFKQSGETLFDRMFDFDRDLKDTVAYAVTMKNGPAEQKQQMRALALVQEKRPKMERRVLREMAIRIATGQGRPKTLGEMIAPSPSGGRGMLEILLAPTPAYASSDYVDPAFKKKKKKKRKRGQSPSQGMGL